jgi:predicted nucleic acid-binding protein
VTATTASDPIVVDSSGWLEYLTEGTKTEAFAPYLEEERVVIVPTVVIYEVRKILTSKKSKTLANIFLSNALRRTIAAFDDVLAVKSAELSLEYKLAMADAIIYATAKHFQVELVTSDSHFADLPGVTLL